MKVTFLGHATLLIEFGGKRLLFDPFISANDLAKGINVDEISADYILLTHGHQDHVLDVETIANRTGAKLISSFEIVTYYADKGLGGHPMNHGGKFQFDFGTVKYVNAIHSSVLPDGTYGGNPGGFVIWDNDHCFYVAGDTALTWDMKLIPMTCPRLDFAVLPIGDNFTMGYEDALIASQFIQCDKIMGYHFDTFPPIKLDRSKAKALFENNKTELIIPEIGQSYEL
ncbi:MAG: metal-dependent hydrolase [Bacteroidota bacterium]